MKRYVVGLAATPLLAYPLLAGCLLLLDALTGERLLVLYLRHDQRLLWDTFWADYATATPVMYAVVAAVVGSFLLLRRFACTRTTVRCLVLMFAAISWVLAVYLTGDWLGNTHLAMSTSGALLGTPVGFFLGRLLRPSTAEVSG